MPIFTDAEIAALREERYGQPDEETRRLAAAAWNRVCIEQWEYDAYKAYLRETADEATTTQVAGWLKDPESRLRRWLRAKIEYLDGIKARYRKSRQEPVTPS